MIRVKPHVWQPKDENSLRNLFDNHRLVVSIVIHSKMIITCDCRLLLKIVWMLSLSNAGLGAFDFLARHQRLDEMCQHANTCVA